jgi:hypothetical protein
MNFSQVDSFIIATKEGEKEEENNRLHWKDSATSEEHHET